MKLEKAYPSEAGIGSLRRELDFVRDPKALIRMRDTWRLLRGSIGRSATMHAPCPGPIPQGQ
jgi:hypothetical protein